MSNEVELYKNLEECCGCGACMNACPKGAISMIETPEGFVYPKIDESKCVKCGLCKLVCGYQNGVEKNNPKKVYVLTNNNEKQLEESASGGAFSVLAEYVLSVGGIVFGATYERTEDELIVKHIGITKVENLIKLQGSKYVQSNIGYTYQETKVLLEEGRLVLYSGTPCQLAGLKGFLRKDYDNLILVEVICHGIPSQKIFNSYIQVLEKRENGKIVEVAFRDKKKGWADYYLKYSVDRNGKIIQRRIHCRISSYYELFLNALIFRENCYSCKYASKERVSDITVGDYWGIENVHTELFKQKKWRKRRYTGISCVLANTVKGIDLIKKIQSRADIVESCWENAAVGNGQLREPCKRTKARDEILEMYCTNGFETVDKHFMQQLGKKKYYKDKIRSLIPIGVKKQLYEIVYKIRK